MSMQSACNFSGTIPPMGAMQKLAAFRIASNKCACWALRYVAA